MYEEAGAPAWRAAARRERSARQHRPGRGMAAIWRRFGPAGQIVGDDLFARNINNVTCRLNKMITILKTSQTQSTLR